VAGVCAGTSGDQRPYVPRRGGSDASSYNVRVSAKLVTARAVAV
jgi:hypothetical protein